jgi:hypothetical protein
MRKLSFVLHSDRDLPRRLASVCDEESLLAFAEHFGELGYNFLDENPNEDRLVPGDPVPWALAHARQVRLVTELLALLKKADTDEIRKALTGGWDLKRRESDGQAESLILKGIDLYGRQFECWESLDNSVSGAEGSRAIAHRLICAIINMNLETARPLLIHTLDEKRVSHFSAEFYVGSAIEDAYTLLCEDILKRTPYQICEDRKCTRPPFRVTESHQRYCPNPDGGASLCGTRKRTEEWRRDHPRKGGKE